MDSNMRARVLLAAHTESLDDLIRSARTHSLCSETYTDDVVRRVVVAIVREMAAEQVVHNERWTGRLFELPVNVRPTGDYLKGYLDALKDVAAGHATLADELDGDPHALD